MYVVCSEQMVGTLTLNSQTELSAVPDDLKQAGFGFQLKTVAQNLDVKVNVFLVLIHLFGIF